MLQLTQEQQWFMWGWRQNYWSHFGKTFWPVSLPGQVLRPPLTASGPASSTTPLSTGQLLTSPSWSTLLMYMRPRIARRRTDAWSRWPHSSFLLTLTGDQSVQKPCRCNQVDKGDFWVLLTLHWYRLFHAGVYVLTSDVMMFCGICIRWLAKWCPYRYRTQNIWEHLTDI